MKQICIGDRYQIQCYKHNGKIHRAWDEAIVLDVKKDYIVVGNEKTKVTESEGTTWRTKEPAILYFFKNKWYNIIAQMKKDGVYYYCNIATPYILEEGTIKYIDYDLDLRVFPKGEYKILDKLEYQYHRKKMEYSDDLDVVINHAMKELLDDYNSGAHMFNKEQNEKYLELYNQLKKEV
jgi:protein associated with RNAse G/E